MREVTASRGECWEGTSYVKDRWGGCARSNAWRNEEKKVKAQEGGKKFPVLKSELDWTEGKTQHG